MLVLTLASAGARAEDLDAAAQAGAQRFDGASRYPTVSKPLPSAQDKAQLLTEFKKHVTINDRGVPAEGAALNAILTRLMDSPTARELAGQFIKEDAKAVISFEELPDTRIIEANGKKEFYNTGGHLHQNTNPIIKVDLNSAYLIVQRHWGSPEQTLAHELLGHALEKARAKRYGVADVNYYNLNDEANAGLVGWTVDAELGRHIANPLAWTYMADPDDYLNQVKLSASCYAPMLSSEEMKDPQAAFKERLADADELLANIPVKKKNNETWLRIIEHLITVHKMDPAAFLTRKENLVGNLKTLPDTEAELRDIRQSLEQLIAKCNGQNGAAWIASLKAGLNSAFFRQQDQEMQKHRQLLAGLMLGKTEQSEAPPDRPGQLTWDQLKELWEKDIASDCGGKL